MERFKIKFEGKSYNAVKINGACVSDEDFYYGTIVLAECSLNEVVTERMGSTDEMTDADYIDEKIFGYAPIELILNGGEEELEQYAKDLL